MPIDVPLWNLVQENKRAVIGELLRQFDPSYGSEDPIYTPDGEWSYARFERWLVNSGVPYWPRLESGQLDIDSDAFRMMYHIPGVEGLHALRDSIGFIVRARLPIGPDGRNRPSLISVLHGNRPKRARQEPVQRARRSTLVHVVLARHDRGLSRLAHTGGRYCRGRLR